LLESTMSGKPVMVITGASYGVGAALAKHFAGPFQVCALARSLDKLGDMAAECSEKGMVDIFACDVSDKQAVKQTCASIIDKHGGVDVLVNNAAVMTQKRLLDMSLDEADQMVDINLKGTIYITHCLMPSMVQRKRGKIIMINSVAGLNSWTPPTETVYCASKHGQTGFASALANEVREHGITVTSLHPGGIDTPLQSQTPSEVSSQFLTTQDMVEAVAYVVHANPKVLVHSMKLFRTAFWH